MQPQRPNFITGGIVLSASSQRHSLRRIFAAIDDSRRAPKEVVITALGLARQTNANVCLFHALDVPQDFPASSHATAVDELPRYLRAEAEHHLAGIAQEAPELSFEILVEESKFAGDAILRAADRFDADLIVIGSHKYGILERALGTTTAHVVRSSERDVLTVGMAVRSAPSDASKSQCVLACLDATADAEQVYQAAANIAKARNLKVHAFRVITSVGEVTTNVHALVAKAIADLSCVANNINPESFSEASAVVDEGAWRALCAKASECRAEIVVVGGRRSGALSSFATTAAHLVQHCDAHVLVAHLAGPAGS